MSKRAPELWRFTRFSPSGWNHPVEGAHVTMRVLPDGEYVSFDSHEAVRRSQRVKLHRERAKWHQAQYFLARCLGKLDLLHDWRPNMKRHLRAAARFSSRADKIERGGEL